VPKSKAAIADIHRWYIDPFHLGLGHRFNNTPVAKPERCAGWYSTLPHTNIPGNQRLWTLALASLCWKLCKLAIGFHRLCQFC